MFSSFQAKDLREGDLITVQTLTGAHTGTVAGSPRRTADIAAVFAVPLDCTSCASRHGLDLPGYRLVAAERKP